MKYKKWFNRRNILNVLFFTTVIVLLFVPAVKALMIRGLMTVGLFQPDIAAKTVRPVVAEDVLFTDSKGSTINLHALKGKVVFINFWATWCPPCQAELPAIDQLYSELHTNRILFF